MGPMCLQSHCRVDLLLELDNFKDVVEGSLRNVDFLNNSRKMFAMFFIMNSLNEDPDICSVML